MLLLLFLRKQCTRYIYLCGFHTRCLYWVSRQPSPRSNYLPSPPMKLTTSQSLPPSSASSVMIMSHSIDLAGLAHLKNSLTLHCFLTWNSNQSDKISPPCLAGFRTKQVSHPPTERSGPRVSADTQGDARVQEKGHLLAKSHRHILNIFQLTGRINRPVNYITELLQIEVAALFCFGSFLA